MGAMGQMLAKATLTERDRVISAVVWTNGGSSMGLHDLGGCLLEHMCGGFAAYMDDARDIRGALRYDRAVHRFGKARVVRAIKLRAAKLNGCSPEAIRSIVDAPAVEVGTRE